MSQVNNEAVESPEKKSRNRSPNYPYLDLEAALSRAGEMHRAYGKHPAPIGNVHKLWKYTEHSGIANQCVAALKSYGLVDVTGQGKDRKLVVSDRADRIIRNAPDRGALLKEAAKEPTIHAELLEEYRENGLPPDDILRTYLVWERDGGRFNEDVVDSFIDRFRATLGFANLHTASATDEKSVQDTTNNGSGSEDRKTAVQVGSFVQWTSQGINQFAEPQKVTGVDGEWAFVEGSETGIFMNDLAVVDPPAAIKDQSPATPPTNPNYKPPVPTGPRIEFPLPDGNSIEIRLKKPVSKKDFERIKMLVELSEDSLVAE